MFVDAPADRAQLHSRIDELEGRLAALEPPRELAGVERRLALLEPPAPDETALGDAAAALAVADPITP